MVAESITLHNLHNTLMSLSEKMVRIELNVEEIHDDLHQVRPEYLQKLEGIKKEKTHHFESKDSFLHFLHHEV